MTATFEGVIEDGQVRLTGSLRPPEGAKVYIIVPDYQLERVMNL